MQFFATFCSHSKSATDVDSLIDESIQSFILLWSALAANKSVHESNSSSKTTASQTIHQSFVIRPEPHPSWLRCYNCSLPPCSGPTPLSPSFLSSCALQRRPESPPAPPAPPECLASNCQEGSYG